MTKDLSPAQKHILEEQGTEPPFSGALLYHKEAGTYSCAKCGNKLFSSDTKFESGSGWPSFYDVIGQGRVELRKDTSLGMERTEVVCTVCKGHLGHVFDDGPPHKTGLRYCINSLALEFEKRSDDHMNNNESMPKAVN